MSSRSFSIPCVLSTKTGRCICKIAVLASLIQLTHRSTINQGGYDEKMIRSAFAVATLSLATLTLGIGGAHASNTAAEVRPSSGSVEPFADEWGGSFSTYSDCVARGNVAIRRGAQTFRCTEITPHPTAAPRWELFVDRYF